ncbi:MAG: peptidoglycan DD-metalloendopeptidase family protein [Tatlockia sp.]|nr:peptidoglycan DD-metalloendopeptidase family protein [Tatlockia sp.]
MDQRPNVSLKNSAKPSKFMALIALVIAFALPFILVKSFPHKHKTNYDNLSQSAKPAQNSPVATKTLDHPDASLPQRTSINSPAAVVKTEMSSSDKKTAAATLQPTTAASKDLTHTIAKQPLPAAATVQKENVTKSIVTRRKDSLAAVFIRQGLGRQLFQAIARENPRIRALTRLRENEQLQYQLIDNTLEKMSIPYSSTQSLILYREGKHYKTKFNAYKITTTNHYVTATVRGSLYSTAKRHNIPSKLIQQMTEIFAWDINFAKEVRANDQFSIIYKSTYANEKLIGTGEIVAVTYKNSGNTFQAVLHTSRTGHSDYYSPKGSSLKNAFNRYPLRFSHISSTFSVARNHPILRYKRPHYGVDLAAPIGTPILATGDGHIEIIGRQSGYGNMIKIKHNNVYSSIYGHMLKFQKGIYKGALVKRGQVIGYVGQTGLATGPHCHYEFHINHQPKNPTTVNLPRGDAVPVRELANFKSNTNNLLNLLKSYESKQFAKTNRRGSKTA